MRLRSQESLAIWGGSTIIRGGYLVGVLILRGDVLLFGGLFRFLVSPTFVKPPISGRWARQGVKGGTP